MRIFFLLTLVACSPIVRTVPDIPIVLEASDGLKLSGVKVIEINEQYFVTGTFDVPHSELHNNKGIQTSILSTDDASLWSKNYCIHYISRPIGRNVYLDDTGREKNFRVLLPGVPTKGHRISIRPLSATESCRD